jgi:hypothetical protein
MSRITLTFFTLLSLLFLGSSLENYAAQSKPNTSDAPTGTLQKMIVENGSVTMDLDLNRFNAISSAGVRPATLNFAAGSNSFFPILVLNDLLRGVTPGTISLIATASNAIACHNLPAVLSASLNRLVVEKFPSGQDFDLAVRDGSTGFTFFNIQGHQYDYDATAKSLAISGGKLLFSKELADAMGRPSDAGVEAGTISVGAVMQPTEITQLANGQPQSMLMPPMQQALGSASPNLVPGPDVIVGNVEDVSQMGSAGTQVGLAIGTDSCNNGDQPIDWFALPNTDHPVVPQNLYRMSGGTDNTERFEQVGHSWMKHTFEALEDTVCGTCNTGGCQQGTHLCPGCSDPYTSGLNGDQGSIGSRAWINPFTGSFPSGANNHSGHNHNGVSHRIRVESSDLNTTLNPNATYFGEAAYISPHEYTWCQSHSDQCNMFNNVSYRQFHVTGTTNFTFSAVGSTFRTQPAIQAWAATGATVNQVEPDPGNDGIFFVGCKVTNPSAGVWHYDYAVYDENLDRGIQSFAVPLAAGVNISNIAFHAPPQEPGWANDGTFNNEGYSSTPWTVTQIVNAITWNSETFAQNQNGNAIRWGTLYNFRFDADQPPQSANASVGFFKTGSPVTVSIQAPIGVGTPSPTPTASPTPTSSATATATPTATATATATATFTPTPTATPTSTATPTPTATATATATPTATATSTPTATPTPRPTPTPRVSPPPRVRPTPAPRP